MARFLLIMQKLILRRGWGGGEKIKTHLPMIMFSGGPHASHVEVWKQRSATPLSDCSLSLSPPPSLTCSLAPPALRTPHLLQYLQHCCTKGEIKQITTTNRKRSVWDASVKIVWFHRIALAKCFWFYKAGGKCFQRALQNPQSSTNKDIFWQDKKLTSNNNKVYMFLNPD